MAQPAPKRSDFPRGLKGNRQYQLAVEKHSGKKTPGSSLPAPPPNRDNRSNRPGSRTVKPTAKPTPKSTAKPQKSAVPAGPGGSATGSGLGQAQQVVPPGFQAPKPVMRSPASAAPVHASPQSFGSAYAPQTQPQGASLPTPTAPQPKAAAPTEQAYGASGKELYMAGKSNNPLMQRTFGYQTGQAPGQQPPQAPEAPQTPQAPTSPQYQGNDEPGALGQAENPMAALAEALKIKKKLTLSISD